VTTVAVIGTGTMGRGIMQWAAEAGAKVLACDARPGAAEEARAFVGRLMDRAVEKGRTNAVTRDGVMARIHPVVAPDDLAHADLVVEAIVEDLEAKRALFAALEETVGDATILCTNTSSLSVTACAGRCRLPQRVAGLHFFNPVPLMKVVEVVRGERTSPDVVDTLVRFVGQSSHRPVLCADTPGFVINHAGRGLYTEGLRIVREGVANFADVDRVMRDCAGFPMGPFELFDLTGLDVSSRVLREIYESFFHERRYQPSPLVYRRVDAGLFGRKVGEGFYRYQEGRRIEPAEAEAPSRRKATFRVDAPPDAARHIVAALVSGGLIEAGKDADITVVAPVGTDATTAATIRRHDAARTVAIDPLFSDALAEGGRATLMTTPLTSRETTDTIHAALLAAGLRVTRIADSPGFIAQRMLANIVNTACEIAQQRIATPSDIEEGVKGGLGYPSGPLGMGDRIGPARVLSILENLHSSTGDQRYAPSLWLRRRAMLNVSLATPE
jgi:3-hydroxybutyryl-CoA dehydrogenase